MSRRYDRCALLVALAMLAVYTIFAASTTLWDRDEPRFCRAAVEMMRTGDYLVPYFNGDLRPDKPILIYWLMNLSMAAFGITEWALRLPSVVGTIIAALFTYLIGKRMFDPRTALRGMIIFATGIMPFYVGTAATADGTLIAWTTAAFFPFIDRLYRGPRWWQFPLMAFAMGMAQLAKGPVGLAVPGLGMILIGILARKQVRLGARFWLAFVGAVLASIGMFIAWGYAANEATNGEFLRLGIGKHVIGRATGAMEGHGSSRLWGYLALIPLYIPIIYLGFFPWTMHFQGTMSALFRGRLGSKLDRAVIFGWALPTFIMMSLVATKLPHYVLPIFPILALAISRTIDARARGELNDSDRKWLREGIWFFLPIAAIGAIAPIVGGILLHDSTLIAKVIPITLAMIIIGAVASIAQRREQLMRASAAFMVGFPVVMLLLATLALPQLEKSLKVSHRVAQAIREALGDHASVATAGFEEGSIIFYLNLPPNMAMRPVHELVENPQARTVEQWAKQVGPAALITTEKEIELRQFDPKALGLKEIFRGDVINYSKGSKHQVVIVLGRHMDEVSLPPPSQAPTAN